MWSTLSLLLLFGTVIGTLATECKLYELPKDGTCEITLKWMARDDKEALATCLEYFPTTFVKGKAVNGYAQCTVTASYTCEHHKSKHPDVFLMFDKCYVFPKENDEYVKGTIPEYSTADASKMCKGGKLSVFYSHTHAKFVGMKAHGLFIDKLWIGITTDGRMIEKDENGKNMMMHKKLWKVVEGDYWDGDELKKVAADSKGEYSYPDNVKYYFMRTRTDHVMNRIQGSFERTTDKMKATFACEFDSKFTADQEWYCKKMPELGIDSVYDDKDPVKPRCLYVTAGSYTFNGKKEDMENIKGCQERPSDLHSAGMDDGTGTPAKYADLKNKGPLRLATHLQEKITHNENDNQVLVQQKCKGPVTGDSTRMRLFQKWRHIDHHGQIHYPAASLIDWDPKYPLNECSDFPGTSTTMGLKNGKKIDMPPEVRAQALCSLTFFQECENKNPCDKKFECKNQNKYQADIDTTKLAPQMAPGFFTCECPGEGTAHKEDTESGKKYCKWQLEDQYCAMFYFVDAPLHLGFPTGKDWNFDDLWSGKRRNDKLYQAVVKEGCRINVRSHGNNDRGHPNNFDLLHEAGYGTHTVPHTEKGTLGGEWSGMAASSAYCWCD